MKKELARFDFNDGNGEVTATRHVNPDGSEEGLVASTTFADVTVTISDGEQVYGYVWVPGSAQVSDGKHKKGS